MNVPQNVETSNIDIYELPLANIAYEIATQMEDKKTVLERYGVVDIWDEIKSNPVFRGMVAEQVQKWGSLNNSSGRIQTKAAIALEDTLPQIYAIAHDSENTPIARIEAAKFLAKVSGNEKPEDTGTASGPAFSITINTGGSHEPTVINGMAEIEG
jgi:hypothetical protein